MKSLLSWIDRRSGLAEVLGKWLDNPVPGGAGWLKVWPYTILFAFCVQAITGFFLWTYYSPGAQTAWESVYFLQYHVAGGWLLRAVHHYSAQMVLVLIGIYLIQTILSGAYRAPRELVFWAAVLMGLFSLGLVLTGDLLAWDQNSYACTQVRTRFLTLLPWIGGGLFKVAVGGPAFGHLTLTRFLALHVGLFGGGFLMLLILHGVLARRADALEAAEANQTGHLWPDQTVRNAVACLGVLVIVLLLALRHGVTGEHAGVVLGSPADLDPANLYAAARPEWAFLGLYEFSHLFPGEWAILPIFVIPGLLLCIVLVMPFVGRGKPGHCFNVTFTMVILIGIVALSFRSVAKDRANPDHQAAIAAEQAQADRVRELARGFGGIPAGSALTLLRDDPKTQGPKLFKQHCASCHDHVDAHGKGIKAEEVSAPNLFGYADRRWVAGFLDPEKIASPDYLGNTKFRRGDMVGFIKETLAELEDDEKQDVEKIVMALSAEARLKSARDLDAKSAKQIQQGRQLLVDDYGCVDCHKFHDKGSLGDAPDLTGYGSREWTIAIISNPAHKQFYDRQNDRMPAYAEEPDDSAQNTLSARDIGLITDWLRK